MKKRKKEVLVIVAHPDDETIWMGGTLLKNQNNWNTTIISLCRAKDKDRAPKFKKVCGILKAKSFISDLEDEKLRDASHKQITTRIKKFARKNYDYIFTHGANGEYGHKRHKEVHFTVEKMIKSKALTCKKLFFFDYVKDHASCRASAKPDKFIKLNAITLLKKRKLIHNDYGFEKRSFEYKCCKDTETFKIVKIK